MLGYTHMKILDEMGDIMHDNPRIHVPVSVRFIVFAPKVGEQLGTAQKSECDGHSACEIGHVRARVWDEVSAALLADALLVSVQMGC